MKKYFITGTDTNIGKTYISKIICENFNFSYYKPIQTGFEEGKDVDFVKKNSNIKVYEDYIFKLPASPYIAKGNEFIDKNLILKRVKNINENLIIEGAGGLMVPIEESYTMLNLIKDLNISVILVAKNQLGEVNKTLLTIKVLDLYKIKIQFVVLNYFQGTNVEFLKNKELIEKFSNVKVYNFKNELEFIKQIKTDKSLN